MLRVDFYESSNGETIVVTFPDGTLGVVDACPSIGGHRDPIAALVGGRDVRFLCLTHPHLDHGKDLLEVLNSAKSVSEFWHTASDLSALLYSVSDVIRVYPDRFTGLLTKKQQDWADFVGPLYQRIVEIGTHNTAFVRKLNAARKPIQIAGVRVAFLGPEEDEQNKYTTLYARRLRQGDGKAPNENRLSAILSLEYFGNTIVLGADAETKNWTPALHRCGEEGISNISVLKVPHHGAKNAHSTRKGSNYLELCRPAKATTAVLFAGSKKHPEKTVFQNLKQSTKVVCLSNGLKGLTTQNPLKIRIRGASATGQTYVCNPHIRFEFHPDGTITQPIGHQCAFCA